jgi:hypothetical protein
MYTVKSAEKARRVHPHGICGRGGGDSLSPEEQNFIIRIPSNLLLPRLCA